MKTDFPYLEIDGWIVRKDIDGNILFNCTLNPKDFYTVYLLKNFVIECSFLKKEYDELPKDVVDQWLRNKLKMVIFEYGNARNFPWAPSRHPKLCYRDKEGKELSIEDLEPLLRDPDYTVIKQEKLGKYFISTVWLGVPHGMGCHYFETMVFLTPEGAEDPRESLGKTLDCYRYGTQKEAIDGHKEVIDEWKTKDDDLCLDK